MDSEDTAEACSFLASYVLHVPVRLHIISLSPVSCDVACAVQLRPPTSSGCDWFCGEWNSEVLHLWWEHCSAEIQVATWAQGDGRIFNL